MQAPCDCSARKLVCITLRLKTLGRLEPTEGQRFHEKGASRALSKQTCALRRRCTERHRKGLSIGLGEWRHGKMRDIQIAMQRKEFRK